MKAHEGKKQEGSVPARYDAVGGEGGKKKEGGGRFAYKTIHRFPEKRRKKERP